MAQTQQTERLALFIGSIVLTAVLYKIVPSVAGPLVLLGTFVHETGHGIAGILVGGEFRELHITEWGGYAIVARPSDSGIASAIISAGGLIGPSFAAMLSFAAARSAKWSRVFLGGVALTLAWLILFKVDNGRGYMVAGVIFAGSAALAIRGSESLNQAVTVFFGIQLALSLYSDTDYLFTQYFSGTSGERMTSDTQNMADALAGPYWFWACVCIAVSVCALLLGAFLMLAGSGKPKPVVANKKFI